MRFLLLLGFLLLSLCAVAEDQARVNKLLEKLQQTNDLSCKAEFLCELSQEYRDSNPKLASSYGKKAIAYAQKIDNKKLLAKAYNNTGAGYFMLGDYETATTYYYGALKIREEIGDSAGLRASYINVANIYASQGDHKGALLHYERALKLAELNKDYIAASRALNNIGKIYQDQKQYDLSLRYYTRALPLKEKIKDTKGVVISLTNIGNLYNLKGYHITALEYFDKALPLAEEIGSLHDKIYVLRGKAVAHKLDQDYNRAISLGKQSLRLAKELKQKNEIKLCADVLNKIYTEMGDYANAHAYLKLYTQYNDSISNDRIKSQIALVQVKYETEKRAKENLKLMAEQKLHVAKLEQNNIVQYFFFAVLALLCIVALILFVGARRLKRVNSILLEKNEQITLSSTVLSKQKDALEDQAKLLQDQKEELERLNGVKDRLFSVIAHDLRGPLVSLKGLLQVMAKGKLPEDKREQLFKSLVKGQQNVLWMLDNLFDWARAQMKGFEVDSQPLDLHALTNENIRLLLPVAVHKDIDMDNRIPEGELVCADKEMMKLVLRNLISNALKFCSNGDKITISTTFTNDFCRVSVEDTGVGIPPEIITRLFGDGNYSSRGTANEKGSGLGLSLCKDFVKQNGGEIWVESIVGVGSTFNFTLPLNKEVNQAPEIKEHELLVAKL